MAVDCARHALHAHFNNMTMNDDKVWTVIETPIGPLTIVACDQGITAINFSAATGMAGAPGEHPLLSEAVRQLREYFAGNLHSFDLPILLEGTAFQKSVWEVLVGIPYGETISYGEQARRLGNPAAVRAVGLANGRNPVPIVVPCHRVIGANGTLTGYAGGLAIKETLLTLEGSLKPKGQMDLWSGG